MVGPISVACAYAAFVAEPFDYKYCEPSAVCPVYTNVPFHHRSDACASEAFDVPADPVAHGGYPRLPSVSGRHVPW